MGGAKGDGSTEHPETHKVQVGMCLQRSLNQCAH